MPPRRTTILTPNSPLSAPEVAGYAELLDELKVRIRTAQVRSALAVNRELIALYWEIGREILVRQAGAGWGARVVDRLADDLRREFPEMRGFSRTNLLYMRAFAEAYPSEAIVQQAVGQIPWGHNLLLLEKLKGLDERLWYVGKTVEHGWSRSLLLHHIKNRLHARQGRALTNFDRTLPAPDSDLAAALLKDPYHFDFLQIGPAMAERDVERALLSHVRDFLLELGVGFALVGSQYRLEVDGQDYHVDLLFFHVRLRRYVVVELKVGVFQPEYVGKMGFYLSAVDALLRQEDHLPSIGLILCKERSRVVAEYSLRGTGVPIGVAEYRMREALPGSFQGSLPSAEELEKELSRVAGGALESGERGGPEIVQQAVGQLGAGQTRRGRVRRKA